MVHLDLSQYDVHDCIPILEEGELVTPREDGQDDTVPVTAALLREIRDNMNRKEENSGDLCVLAVGHIKRENGVEETSQAPVIGFAKDWTVHTRPGDGKKVLCYREFLRKEFADVPRKYPRRSADLWLNRKEIDPIAYLGATTPHRDVGLHPLSLSRQGDTVLRVPYTMADETKGDAKLTDAMNEIVKQLSELKTMLEKLSAGGPAAPAGEPEMSPEQAEAELQKLLGEQAPAEPQEKKPTQMARQDGGDPEKDALKKQLDAVVLQLARTDMAAKLKEMSAEGVLIPDIDAEVTDLLALPPDLRVAQLARISKNYKKAPGAKVNPALKDAEGAQGEVTAENVSEIVSLAKKEKISYELAREKKYGSPTPMVKK